MNLCGYGEVSIDLWTFAVDDYNTETCAARLILCDSGLCVCSLEGLDLLEVRVLFNGTHGVVLERRLKELRNVNLGLRLDIEPKK